MVGAMTRFYHAMGILPPPTKCNMAHIPHLYYMAMSIGKKKNYGIYMYTQFHE